MDQVVAREFNPSALRDSHDIKSHEQQNDHPWTVLPRVFVNDMGRLCVNNHAETRDAQQAFLDHQRQQENSKQRECNSGAMLADLTTFLLSNHDGTRMSFITEWFVKHQCLNEMSEGMHGHKFICRVLQQALRSDD